MPLSAPVLFDTHCHLDLPELAADLPAYLNAAVTAGVRRILVPAVEAARWRGVLQLQQQTAALTVDVALGIHPWWAESATEQQLAELASLLQTEPNVCAVGEIGLDFALAKSGEDEAAMADKKLPRKPMPTPASAVQQQRQDLESQKERRKSELEAKSTLASGQL